MSNGIFGRLIDRDTDDQWISVSDLMAGLMIVFLFIAITYIRDAIEEQKKIEEIAITWREGQINIYEALKQEFKDDFPKWNAEIEKETLIIRFNNPEVLFEQGSLELAEKFRNILSSFCPRYLNVLVNFRDSIEEVRIEGHTSSEWNNTNPLSYEAYFGNMALSQGRTRSVLQYCIGLDFGGQNWLKGWAKEKLTANGLSSSRLVLENGRENKQRSRRVEFRVQTKVKDRIVKIIETIDAR
jgi:outer membrane protein OmpA-like peptidoglycan-associated protein